MLVANVRINLIGMTAIGISMTDVHIPKVVTIATGVKVIVVIAITMISTGINMIVEGISEMNKMVEGITIEEEVGITVFPTIMTGMKITFKIRDELIVPLTNMMYGKTMVTEAIISEKTMTGKIIIVILESNIEREIIKGTDKATIKMVGISGVALMTKIDHPLQREVSVGKKIGLK
jgi:hypothetical protein